MINHRAKIEREMRLNIQKLANVTQKGFDLKDPRITAEILNMYREIMTDPKKHYGILYDQISGTAQADQIHKKAKELFGDDAGSGGGKKRSFFQKTGFSLSKKDIIKEIVKSGKDPQYFINNYCRISHPMHGLIPFKTYPYQDDF